MNGDTEKFKTNVFYHYANLYYQMETHESEIDKVDFTDKFFKELDNMIKEKELIIININGKVRLGKSTEAIALGKHVFGLLKKYKIRRENEFFSLKNIARDQREQSKLMRDPNVAYTVIVTDEMNKLEETGENVTVEQKLEDTFTDVHAARYVHKIACSPKDIIDSNADILLEVVSTNKKTMITHNKLYYRFLKEGYMKTQYLGYVNIPVKDLIYNWTNKVEKHFVKRHKTPEDEKIIEEWRKQDFYVEYIIKKHEKINLLTREWITVPRKLDYAEAIIIVVNKLKPILKNTPLSDKQIRNFLKKVARERKLVFSIIGEKLATDEISGILECYKYMYNENRKLFKIQDQLSKGKIDQETFNEQQRLIRENQVAFKELIDSQMDELHRYADFNKQYHEFLTN